MLSSAGGLRSRQRLGSARAPRTGQIDPIDVQIIQRQFASVRELKRVTKTFKGAKNFLEMDDYAEPSFRRLFTHSTWKRYTGGSSLSRLMLSWSAPSCPPSGCPVNHCTQ